MATTEILVEGYDNWSDLTVLVMVLAVDLILLKVAAALMLLDTSEPFFAKFLSLDMKRHGRG